MNTIAAIATPLLNCAIHIIRVSGPDCFKFVQKICEKKIRKEPYTIQRNFIIDNDKRIDDVLLNVFVKPKSYTGEDTIEINCHGGVVVAKKILNLLISNGCVRAKNGEFSQQAFLNNKLSYMQIEAINNLIHAESDKVVEIAMNSIAGNDLDVIKKIRSEIFDIIGSIEVNIDYPEYDDVPNYSHKEIYKKLTLLKKEIDKIIKSSKKIIPIFNGLNVAIIGKPNVGKSSLLNLLSNSNRAIVSDIKGTTRDVIESKVNFNGILINFLDTAGIHEQSKDKIEKIGIEKSKQTINDADLIIWLVDNDKDNELIKLLSNKNYIKVFNKSDINNYKKGLVTISVKNRDISNLNKELEKHLAKISNFKSGELILQSTRQITLMEKLSIIVENLLEQLKNSISLDLLQTQFEECIIVIDNILGVNFKFDKLDELFSKFCLGK